MRNPSSNNGQLLRGIKKAAAFSTIGLAGVAITYLATVPVGAPIAALMLIFQYWGKPVLLPPCFILLSRTLIEALKLLTRHTPSTYDAMLWRLDELLGFQPSIVAKVLASTIPGLWEVLKIAYHRGLLVAMVLAGTGYNLTQMCNTFTGARQVG
jgi:hypothetical protein